MTSLRRALKASLSLEEKPPSFRPSHRNSGGRAGNGAGEESGRHNRRYTDDMLGDRHGYGANSDRNRTTSGASSRSHSGRRRGGSFGDGDDDGDSLPEGDSGASDGSDSDSSVTITGRGRSSAPDRRRLGSGSGVKREKREPVPVSPPRQGIIAAAHEAEIGSQIKVKFDTGHWYGGTILEVDSQRGMIRIDYEDGTQEVSDIPDSDVVIYPWHPPHQRVRPRPLSQLQQEQVRSKVGAGQSTNNSRKHRVKSEPLLVTSPRRRGGVVVGRGRSSKREQRGARSGSNSRGASKVASSASSYEEGGEESEAEEGEDEQWEGGGGDGEGVSLTEARKVRWQQRGGKSSSTKGKPSLQGQGQRKRSGGITRRKASALKRRRSARDGNDTTGGSMSESASAMSEEEEELDDLSLGIKTKPRSPRASPRRRSAVAGSQQKKKRAAGRAVTEGAVAKGGGSVAAAQGARATVGSSSHSGSSSESSASDSSASRSSSESGSGINARSAVARRSERGKVVPFAAVQPARAVPPPQKQERGKDEKGQKEAADIAKEGGQRRGKAGQRKERRQESEAIRTEKLTEPNNSKAGRPPVAETKGVRSDPTIKLEPRQETTAPYMPCGWQTNTSMRKRQVVVEGSLGEAAKASTVVGIESRGARGRGGRGHARGSGKAKPTSPAKLKARRCEEGERPPMKASTLLVEQVSTPVAQACAERKETHSPDLSLTFRKSPRSKETPSCPRLGDGIIEVLRTGVPEVAEAKRITATSARVPLPPASDPPNGDTLEKSVPGGVKPASPEKPERPLEEGGDVAPIEMRLRDGAERKAEPVDRICVSDEAGRKAEPVDRMSVSGEANGVIRKQEGVSQTPVTETEPRRLSDGGDGKVQALHDTDIGNSPAKTSPSKGPSKGKPKGKVKNTRVAEGAANLSAKTTTVVVLEEKRPTPSDMVDSAPAVLAADTVTNDNTSEELLSNGIRDAASGNMQVESADEASSSLGAASGSPVAALSKPRPLLSAASPTSQTIGQLAMELDPAQEANDTAPKPEQLAVKRRLYSPDRSVGEESKTAATTDVAVRTEVELKDVKGKVGEVVIGGDNRGWTAQEHAPGTVGSGAQKMGRKGVSKPARKRPRNEQTQGTGAKSDWPAPLPSRSTRPESESVDVDEGVALVPSLPESDHVDVDQGVAPLSSPSARPESESMDVDEGDVGDIAPSAIAASAPSSPKTTQERVPDAVPSVPEQTVEAGEQPAVELANGTPTLLEDQPVSMEGVSSTEPTPLEEDQPVSKEGVSPPEASPEPPSTTDNGTKEEGDGGHQGRDPGSGVDAVGGEGDDSAAKAHENERDAAVRGPEHACPERGSGPGSDGKADVVSEGMDVESCERETAISVEVETVLNVREDAGGGSDDTEATKGKPEVVVTPAITQAEQDGDKTPAETGEVGAKPGETFPPDTPREDKNDEKAVPVEVKASTEKDDLEGDERDNRVNSKDVGGGKRHTHVGSGDIPSGASDGGSDEPKHVKEDPEGIERDNRVDSKDTGGGKRHTRVGSGDIPSGASDGGSDEPKHVGRKRVSVTRFEPSMDPDRHRLGNQRPERHERQAAVLATKRLAASAPIRRASRGRGQDSGGRGRGGGRGRRGRGRGYRGSVQEQEVESEEDDDDDEEGVDWVQCDNCEKWWTLPATISADDLPDVWHCRMQNWGKPVVDCLVSKDARVTKGGRGAAQNERGGRSGGRGAGRGSSIASTAAAAAVAAAAAATAVTVQPSTATGVAMAAVQAIANAEAKAAAALLVAAATATPAPPPPPPLPLPLPLPLPAMKVASTILPTPDRGSADVPVGEASVETGDNSPQNGKPSASGLATKEVEAPLSPSIGGATAETQPALPLPVPLLEAAGNGPEKPQEEKTEVTVRRKRRRESASIGSSSDDNGGDGGVARDASVAGAGAGDVEETVRARSNSTGGRWGGKGRGRKSSGMGRDAVAFLLKAAESRGDGDLVEEAATKPERAAADAARSVAVGAFSETVKADQWVSCDHKNCGKWRRVPPGVNLDGVDKWYCEMATWHPETASCDYPEDSADMLTPTASTSTVGGKSFVVAGGGGGGRGGGSNRGRRIGSRGRTTSEISDVGGDDDRSWRRDSGTALERRSSEGGGGGGRKARAKKEDVVWVACESCDRWRKLAPGMRLEDLPEKWYCQMNTWSIANHCSYPDEYDEETKGQANGDRGPVTERGGGAGGAKVVAGGLLARGAGGGRQKANGRLSFREIIFNNDGKLRPPYSAGPCASASAGYLFPKPGDNPEASLVHTKTRTEPESHQDAGACRRGFHYSEKYCSSTGPQRPPPRQDLLTASFKLTNLLSPLLARTGGGTSAVTNPYAVRAHANGELGDRGAGEKLGADWGRRAGSCDDAGWAGSNGRTTPRPATAIPPESSGGAAAPTSSSLAGRNQFPLPRSRRVGTYERERAERGLVLHYLRAATAPPPHRTASSETTVTPNSQPSGEGATASNLLAAMQQRPWEGRPNAGTPQEWAEWIERLEPTLERHLRWLTVDGLAARSTSTDASDARSREGRREARFVAVFPPAEEGGEAGGKASAGRAASVSTGGKAAAVGGAGGPGVGAGLGSGAGSCMLTGRTRIMKSRPIKMVKPWR